MKVPGELQKLVKERLVRELWAGIQFGAVLIEVVGELVGDDVGYVVERKVVGELALVGCCCFVGVCVELAVVVVRWVAAVVV